MSMEQQEEPRVEAHGTPGLSHETVILNREESLNARQHYARVGRAAGKILLGACFAMEPLGILLLERPEAPLKLAGGAAMFLGGVGILSGHCLIENTVQKEVAIGIERQRLVEQTTAEETDRMLAAHNELAVATNLEQPVSRSATVVGGDLRPYEAGLEETS